MKKIEPRTLPGFMELLPEDQIKFNQMKKIIQETYECYGFLPLDTPIIELQEVLLAKAGGETEKQIYQFEKGDNKLALRFDLTVPLAKYVAKNYGNLSFPFRRYQIGKVYRGERAQKGRYREFYQCDIDIIGDETLDIVYDAELPSIIYTTFTKLGFQDFTIRMNNRKILNGLFAHYEQTQNSAEILRIVDKIEKIGKEAVEEELEKIGIPKEAIAGILQFIEIEGTTEEKLEKLQQMPIQEQTYLQGVQELKEVVQYVRLFGVPDKNFKIDLSIARGLDYYTGTVYETFLEGHRELGSVCSGGRYENLSEYYTDRKMPGVGISIGLTRLFYKLNELHLVPPSSEPSIAEIIILPVSENELPEAAKLATKFRKASIRTEVYIANKKIKAKMKYADKLNIPYVAVIGEEEVKTQNIQVKNMQTGETTSLEEWLKQREKVKK